MQFVRVPMNALAGWFHDLFQDALSALCKTPPGKDIHRLSKDIVQKHYNSVHYVAYGFFALHLHLVTRKPQIELLKHVHLGTN